MPDPTDTFLARVEFYSIPEPVNGCHLWTGTLNNGGYAVLKYEGKVCKVTRLLWKKNKGPIPEGHEMRHRCDVRSCVNLDHLLTGTRQDNMDDKVLRGRQSCGAQHSAQIRKSIKFQASSQKGRNNGNAKLTLDQLTYIRESRLSLRLVAAEVGCSKSNASRIRRGVQQ